MRLMLNLWCQAILKTINCCGCQQVWQMFFTLLQKERRCHVHRYLLNPSGSNLAKIILLRSKEKIIHLDTEKDWINLTMTHSQSFMKCSKIWNQNVRHSRLRRSMHSYARYISFNANAIFKLWFRLPLESQKIFQKFQNKDQRVFLIH